MVPVPPAPQLPSSTVPLFSKLLLVRLRQIGDVVFTTPAVGALRRQFPKAHIAYVVEESSAPVVAGHPAIDEVIVAPRHGLAGDLALGRRLRRDGYDVAIDFHGGPRASLLTWLSRARVRIGYDVVARGWMYTCRIPRPRQLRRRHSVENQWDLIAPLGIPSPERERDRVTMAVDPSAARSVELRLAAAGVGPGDALIIVHVSAGNPFRRWPIASFGELVARLAAHDSTRKVVVTSGPSEAKAAVEVVSRARDQVRAADADRILSSGEFSLAELRALVQRAALFIGGDSGPMHVASTSQVPIVGLYGPTLPVRSQPWRPAGFRAEAVEIDGLPCRPCDQRRCEPGDFRCLGWISVDEVAAAAERAITPLVADSPAGPRRTV